MLYWNRKWNYLYCVVQPGLRKNQGPWSFPEAWNGNLGFSYCNPQWFKNLSLYLRLGPSNFPRLLQCFKDFIHTLDTGCLIFKAAVEFQGMCHYTFDNSCVIFKAPALFKDFCYALNISCVSFKAALIFKNFVAILKALVVWFSRKLRYFKAFDARL